MSAASTPGGIGSALREARERRGMSLRQISNTTRISVSVLESLERNDISRLPGGLFSRAFVRAYALEVGLDPEDVIRDFIAQFPLDSVTAGHPAARQPEDGVEIQSRQRTASVFGSLIALSVPIVALLLYFGAGDPVPAPATDEPTPVALDSGVAAVEPTGGPTVIPDRLLVGIVATAACWVSVTVDGRPAFTRELRAGERELLEVAKEIVVTAGDAAALRLTLNGREARPLGASGQAVTVTMNVTNFEDFLTAP